MNESPRHIRERFPDQKHTIDRFMTENTEFSALCEDFDACADALRYWIKSEAPESQIRVNEYCMLIQELQEEIVQAMAVLKQR